MKGFVFSLDAAFSVFVAGLILAAAVSYMRVPFSSGIPETSAVLQGSDIVSALDKKGVFDSLDTTLIANNLTQALPPNLNMSLNISIYDEDLKFKEAKQVNTDLTENYYKGKWLLAVGNLSDVKNYVLVEYKVKFL